MSDVSDVVEVKMPPFDPDPDDLVEYPCDECGKVMHSAMALQGHRTSHRTPTPCPECGKQYKTAGALGNHRKNTHGVPSANGAKHLPAPRPPKAAVPVKSEYNADDIVQAAMSVLWPEGVLPLRAVLPMIAWRDATIEFLEKISD